MSIIYGDIEIHAGATVMVILQKQIGKSYKISKRRKNDDK